MMHGNRRDRRVLDQVNLRVPAGATVAIVGHTGCGKSTLAMLIPRLIDPSAGAVTVDGVDVREFFTPGTEARDRRTAGRLSCSARPWRKTFRSA